MKLLKIGMCLLSIFLTPSVVLAQPNMKLKIGFMLPYSGTFAALGNAIENGFTLYIKENGGKLAGREIVYVKVDDESDPSKATDNVNKLIKRDNVDVIIGTVHSGVAMAMAKVAKDTYVCFMIWNGVADQSGKSYLTRLYWLFFQSCPILTSLQKYLVLRWINLTACRCFPV